MKSYVLDKVVIFFFKARYHLRWKRLSEKLYSLLTYLNYEHPINFSYQSDEPKNKSKFEPNMSNNTNDRSCKSVTFLTSASVWVETAKLSTESTKIRDLNDQWFKVCRYVFPSFYRNTFRCARIAANNGAAVLSNKSCEWLPRAAEPWHSYLSLPLLLQW